MSLHSYTVTGSLIYLYLFTGVITAWNACWRAGLKSSLSR